MDVIYLTINTSFKISLERFLSPHIKNMLRFLHNWPLNNTKHEIFLQVTIRYLNDNYVSYKV
jgi:hypothetical protein